MASLSIPWTTGSGYITLTFTGEGDNTVVVSSDANDLTVARTQTLTITTTAGSPVCTVTVTLGQAALAEEVLILAMTPIVTEDSAYEFLTEGGAEIITENSESGEILLADGDTISIY